MLVPELGVSLTAEWSKSNGPASSSWFHNLRLNSARSVAVCADFIRANRTDRVWCVTELWITRDGDHYHGYQFWSNAGYEYGVFAVHGDACKHDADSNQLE